MIGSIQAALYISPLIFSEHSQVLIFTFFFPTEEIKTYRGDRVAYNPVRTPEP